MHTAMDPIGHDLIGAFRSTVLVFHARTLETCHGTIVDPNKVVTSIDRMFQSTNHSKVISAHHARSCDLDPLQRPRRYPQNNYLVHSS